MNYRVAYEAAARYEIPVVFHTGGTYGAEGLLKYADPLVVDEIAKAYPDVTFVIAHCGQPWIQSAAAVADRNPNVYLDGSGMIVGDIASVPSDAVERLIIEPLRRVFAYLGDATKLIYGSDWPLTPMGPYLDAFKRAIPREHWDAVFYENARRVYFRSQPTTWPASK